MKKRDPQRDPKGLIFDSFQIEGITPAQCRSIFLDWALSLPDGAETTATLKDLLAEYEDQYADHPMTKVMQDGLLTMAAPKRRGGWRSRPRS